MRSRSRAARATRLFCCLHRSGGRPGGPQAFLSANADRVDRKIRREPGCFGSASFAVYGKAAIGDLQRFYRRPDQRPVGHRNRGVLAGMGKPHGSCIGRSVRWPRGRPDQPVRGGGTARRYADILNPWRYAGCIPRVETLASKYRGGKLAVCWSEAARPRPGQPVNFPIHHVP